MSRRLQFAVLILVLVSLSAPATATLSCIGATQAVGMSCCPTMENAPALHLLPQHRGCCDLSNAKPTPVAALQSLGAPLGAVSQISSEMPDLLPAAGRVARLQSRPLRLPESSQSFLCVFLI